MPNFAFTVEDAMECDFVGSADSMSPLWTRDEVPVSDWKADIARINARDSLDRLRRNLSWDEQDRAVQA